jgi:hypothetical protein
MQHEKLKACKAADLFEYILVGGDEVVAGKCSPKRTPEQSQSAVSKRST